MALEDINIALGDRASIAGCCLLLGPVAWCGLSCPGVGGVAPV